jgi:hypothetical protein
MKKRQNVVHLENENQLHWKVVDYIRQYLPHTLVIPGLGEHQDTQWKRIDSWRKGYRKGQPDIIILNKSGRYTGLAIELKSPSGGQLSSEQENFLQNLACMGYKTLVSSNYDEICNCLRDYMASSRHYCTQCRRWTARPHKHEIIDEELCPLQDTPQFVCESPPVIDADHTSESESVLETAQETECDETVDLQSFAVLGLGL